MRTAYKYLRHFLKMHYCGIYDIKSAIFSFIVSALSSVIMTPVIFFFMAGQFHSKNWGLLGLGIYALMLLFFWLPMLEGRCRYYSENIWNDNK